MEHPVSSPHQARYCFVLFLLFFITERIALAGEWSVIPSVYVGASNNDNIFLSSPGAESSDSILQVNPAIRVDGVGRRGNVSLYYEMQNIFYRENSEFSDTYHILNARGNVELFPELFFIDASVGRAQQTISRDDAIPLDNISISANRTDVDIVSVSPFIRTNIGDELTTEIRYESARTSYDQGILEDVINKAVYADLRNNLTSSRAQWGVIYSNRKFEAEIGGNYSYQRTYVDIDYSATGQLGLLASGGYENNGYNQTTITRTEKGSTWDVGLRWNPGRQNTISIRVGERVFGKTMSLDFRYLAQRWAWGASYNEEFENNLSVLVGNQQNDATAGEIILPGDPTATTEAYLSRDFNFTARRSFGKTDIDFSAYDRKREFQQTNEKERISGVDVELDWRFQKRNRFLFGMQVENQKLRGSFSSDKLVMGNIGLARQISRDASVELDFRHYRRDSNESTRRSYMQNQATLGLTLAF